MRFNTYVVEIIDCHLETSYDKIVKTEKTCFYIIMPRLTTLTEAFKKEVKFGIY